MSYSTVAHFVRLIIPALIVLVALTACDKPIHQPTSIASYTFSQLVQNETIGFQLLKTQAPVLLVRVEGRETVFESRVLNEDGQVLSAARLPDLRVGPVFHVLEQDQVAGPVTISVVPQHLNSDSQIKIRVFALQNETELDEVRILSFWNYGEAVETTTSESAEDWEKRVVKLRLAAAGFANSGDIESQLWASFLEAQYNYFPLANHKTAVEQAKRIQERALRAELPKIELMALQLEGQALIEPGERDSPQDSQLKHIRAQKVLSSAAILADELDMQYERARAINTWGRSYYYLESYPEARNWYEQALDIAVEIEDSYLQDIVESNLLQVREKLNGLK